MKEITAAQAASYAKAPLFCGPEENTAVSVERDSKKTGEKSILAALQEQRMTEMISHRQLMKTDAGFFCCPLRLWRNE